MKHLVGKGMSKQVDFMDDKVNIKKLSVAEIMKIQDHGKKAKEGDELSVLRAMIRLAVEEAKDLKDAEIDSFPLDELSKLGAEIVQYSGMAGQQASGEVEAGN